MYEMSKDYLNKLISASGLKLGTAKHGAMVSLIELLDKEALDGLIAAIRGDYETMKEAVRKKDAVIKDCERACESIRRQKNNEQYELNKLREEVQAEKDALASLRGEKDAAKLDAILAVCSDKDKSRVMAYRAAVEVGKSQVDGRMSQDMLMQILRSASNVASGWAFAEPTEERSTEVVPLAKPKARVERE